MVFPINDCAKYVCITQAVCPCAETVNAPFTFTAADPATFEGIIVAGTLYAPAVAPVDDITLLAAVNEVLAAAGAIYDPALLTVAPVGIISYAGELETAFDVQIAGIIQAITIL